MKNIIQYKKPVFWIISAIIIVVSIAICCLKKGKEESEQIISSVTEYSPQIDDSNTENEYEHDKVITIFMDAEELRLMWYDLRDYPIYPGDEEWARFSYEDSITISNPTEEMLNSFTSLELARLLLRYPFLGQDVGYDHIEFFFDFLESNSYIYNELWAREDGVLCLIQAYEENELDVDLINESEIIPFTVNNQAETFIFEFITYFQNDLSVEELTAFQTAYENKKEKYYSKINSQQVKRQWSIVFSIGADEERSYQVYTITDLNQWKDKWYELRDYPDVLSYAPSGYSGYSFDWDEYRELMNPPEDLLEIMASDELADLLLRYYDIAYYPDYENVDTLFDRLETNCDILKELLSREDGITSVLEAYENNEIKECSVGSLTESDLRNGYMTIMAELFSCRFVDRYSDRFTVEDIELYQSIYQKKKSTYEKIPETSTRIQFCTVLSE